MTLGPETLEELAGLLRELRSSRGLISRARLLRRGTTVIRRLTPDEKRELAVEIARMAAPDLVPRIEAETGRDLTDDQITAVLDMLRRLDREQIDELEGRLRDPTGRQRVLEDVARSTAAAAAAATGLDDVVTPPTDAGPIAAATVAEAPPEGTDGEPTAGGDEGVGRGAVRGTTAAAGTAAAAALDEVEPSDVGGFSLAMPELADWRPEPLRADLFTFDAPSPPRPGASARGPSADVPADADAGAGERTERSTASRATGRPGGARPRRGARVDSPGPGERSWFGGGDLGIAEVRPERSSTAARLGAIERPSERLRRFHREVADLDLDDVATTLGVVHALPDGWVRRRGIEALLRTRAVDPTLLARLTETLARATDRRWVVATALDRRRLDADALLAFERLLGPAATARLRRRYGAPADG